MVRILALAFALILSSPSLQPVLGASSQAPSTRIAVRDIRFVEQRLDRVLRLLNTAEELVAASHLDKTDQGIAQAVRLVRDAERKTNDALVLFRHLEATSLSKGPVGQVERLSTDARALIREAVVLVDRTGRKSMNYKKLRGLLIGADTQIDQARKMLLQMEATL